MSEKYFRTIKSYVVRGGRMTVAQERATNTFWPRYGVEYEPAALDLDALFGRRAQRVLEIGFGNGENLAALAHSNPDIDFLGVEVHPPGVGHLLLQVQEFGLTNVRVSHHDAVEVLTTQLPPASLDRVLVLFPDPWHKTRHHKRRLINPGFAERVHSCLKPGGILQLATDWTPYAEWMLEVLNPFPGFKNQSPDGRWIPRDASRAPTRFERRGERLGHSVHDLSFERL
jgi:tRNA (guanine-N7-)-methyltransferase